MYKVIDFYNYIDSFAPFNTQEEWDNSGFLIGDKDASVKKAAVMLDITDETLEKAIKLGVQLIVSHHPIIFSPVKSLMSDSIEYKAVKAGINIISAHTSFDNNGVNDVLAETIGLQNIRVYDALPMFRLGDTAVPDKREFLISIKEKLAASLRYNRVDKEIKTVAVCGGSGGSYVNELTGVDAYITGDAGHHDFLDAERKGILLIAAGHFETERIAMPYMAKKLSEKFTDTEIILLEEESPVKHI